jgi:hypothetical protein
MFSEGVVKKINSKKAKLLSVLKKAISIVRIPLTSEFVVKNYLSTLSYEKNKKLNILHSLKFKKIQGVRLEVAGRLSKRLTASRSIYKVKYAGKLKDINTSKYSNSSLMLRGVAKSNLQYSKLSSKNRSGSFGLKG